MFTGIITNIGEVEELKFGAQKDLLVKISTKKIIGRKLEIGCSIACNGVCLTLVKKEISSKKNPKKNLGKTLLHFQASKETLDKTNLKNWQNGELVNLEFALRFGDELGGHLVLGHVDGCVKIAAIKKIKDSHKFTFAVKDKKLLKFIAPKGSVTLNGTSLTVNEVDGGKFTVNVISHTIENTAFQLAKVGDLVNLEIDMMARYLERLIAKK